MELGFGALPGVAWMTLDLATVLAEAESRARALPTGHGVAVARLGGFAEVDVPERHPLDELEAEGFLNTVGGKGTLVAAQNREFLREKRMKIVEEKLAEAVAEARLLGIGQDDLNTMLTLLYGEESL